jgi:L-threonylcarbamoyladenylate synthase
VTITPGGPRENIINAAKALQIGKLVAFPTETVYGLGADASNESAVRRIYEVKKRPSNHPLIVHISSFRQFPIWVASIPNYVNELAKNFWPGPVTLVLKRSHMAKDFITGNQELVGVRIPKHPVALQLLVEFEKLGGHGVVAPSANMFGSVSPTCAFDVLDDIGKRLKKEDIILDGGECEIGIESTILLCTEENIKILRYGNVTRSQIENLVNVEIEDQGTDTKVRASGLLEKHYSPNAKVILDQSPVPGDGLIALSTVPTPAGVTRLAAPNDIRQFGQTLYKAMRLGDKKNLSRIIIISPPINEISQPVLDRITKAAAL